MSTATAALGAIVGGGGAEAPASLSGDVGGAISWSGTAGPEGEAVKNGGAPANRSGASRADTDP